MKANSFTVGSWRVEPQLGRLSRAGTTVEVQPITMQLLCFMAERAGEVLSHDELLEGVWGDTVVSDNVIYWNINQLRKVLGSDDDNEQYVQTLPKRGYRLVAPVSDGERAESGSAEVSPSTRSWSLLVIAVIAVAGIVIGSKWFERPLTDGGPGGEADPVTLAVLPFVNMSTGPDGENFADGFTEELLNVISQLPQLRVIARTSSFYYKNKNIDLRDVGETLGVGHLIEGSVRRAQDRVRITVQLIEAENGHHRWSRTYDRRLVDALDVQKDVAEQVARALEIHLSPTDVEHLGDDRNIDAEALALYRKAEAMTDHRRGGPEAMRQEQQALEEVLEIEPGYLPALSALGFNYAMLRSIYSLSFENSVEPARSVIERMREHGHADTGEYQFLLALVSRLEMSAWGVTRERIEEVGAAYERAIELRPNDPQPLLSYAIHARRLGDLGKAGELLQRAALLDPLDIGVNLQLSRVLGASGRFEEAFNRARALTVHHPGNASSYTTVAEVLAGHGRFAQAVTWLEKAPLSERDYRLMFLLRIAHFAMGDRDGAVDWIYRSGITPEEEALVLGIRDNWQDAAMELDRLLRNNPSPERWQKEFAADASFLAGRFESARFLLESAAPELVDVQTVELHQQNYRYAIKLAATLQELGETARAEALLAKLEAWLADRHRIGWEGYTISKAEVLVLQGRRAEAIAELRGLFDSGWKQLYGTLVDSWYGQLSPVLARLGGERAFVELQNESDRHLADMRTALGKANN